MARQTKDPYRPRYANMKHAQISIGGRN